MSIWKREFKLEELNKYSEGVMPEFLGIKFTEVGEDYLKGIMPVESRTHQPMGILHGGASVVFAETLGSVAGTMALSEEYYCVGLDINANHLSSVREGNVVGIVRPIHVGKSTQVWDIRIHKEDTEKPVCISRLTLAVLPIR